MKAYLSAARSLYAPRAAPRFNHKRAKIAEFGLRGVSTLQSAVNETSVLKATSALGELQVFLSRSRCALSNACHACIIDSWTPMEIRVFEVAIECYGKDFHRISRVVRQQPRRCTNANQYLPLSLIANALWFDMIRSGPRPAER